MDKEELILRKRFHDLAYSADSKGILLFSDFLNLNEQNIFLSIKHELPKIKYFSFGGFSDAERKILCFCGDEAVSELDEITFPIDCIRIRPTNQKFSDALTHRDFLGAVINLGIDRSKLGDILILENEGYLFCHATISRFIVDQLLKVKHTMIRSEIIDQKDFHYTPNLKEISGTVSSVRLDSVISVAFHSSRSSMTPLIEGGKVYVNGKVILSNSYALKENDTVSVRGMGKFIYAGTNHVTKKGRISVKVLLYV